MGPTMVSSVVAAAASAMACLSVLPARDTTSKHTSNRAWTKPTNCVHCLPVDASYASDSSFDVSPVNELLNGWLGVHHTSLAKPSPVSPSASTADETNTAFAIVTSFGLNPCCLACVQNVAKSGGMGMPQTISAPPSFICPMMLEKSSLNGWNRPGSIIV